MPTITPKFRNRGESQHWSRVYAAVIGSFKFWSKPKAKPSMVDAMAAEVADLAVFSQRKRVKS